MMMMMLMVVVTQFRLMIAAKRYTLCKLTATLFWWKRWVGAVPSAGQTDDTPPH